MSIKHLRWLMVALLLLSSVALPSAKAETANSGILSGRSGTIAENAQFEVPAGWADRKVPVHPRRKPVVTPEPGSLLLLGTGIALLLLASFWRKSKMTLV
jgi:hypothetical protein